MSDLTQIFRITFARQLSLLSTSILKLVAVSFISIYLLGISLTDFGFIIMISSLFVFDTLPTMILHWQYWKNGRFLVIRLNRPENILAVDGESGTRTYDLNQIQHFQYYASFGGGSPGWYSFADYRYFKLIFNDGFQCNISSLMMKNIKHELEPLLRLKAEKKLKVLPFM